MNHRTLIILTGAITLGLGFMMGKTWSGSAQDVPAESLHPAAKQISAPRLGSASAETGKGELSSPESVEPESSKRQPLVTEELVLDLLGAQVEALRMEVEKLTALLAAPPASRQIPAAFPTLELLNSAPSDQNWQELDVIIDTYTGSSQGQESVNQQLRWKSQEELLRVFGRPTRILNDGAWVYIRDGKRGTAISVHFSFIGNYVMQLMVL